MKPSVLSTTNWAPMPLSKPNRAAAPVVIPSAVALAALAAAVWKIFLICSLAAREDVAVAPLTPAPSVALIYALTWRLPLKRLPLALKRKLTFTVTKPVSIAMAMALSPAPR